MLAHMLTDSNEDLALGEEMNWKQPQAPKKGSHKDGVS